MSGNRRAIKEGRTAHARLAASGWLADLPDQRHDLEVLYYIADQLGRSIAPDAMRRRAVELASTIFGTRCVLLAGRFQGEDERFIGTITYWTRDDGVVERLFPDREVTRHVPFYDEDIVDRWLAGELEEETRVPDGSLVAFPVLRYGRRLGLILAPVLKENGTLDGRDTPLHPDVAKAWITHLGISLELSALQRERVQRERLAAIGETVAGVSHSLKNTLNGLQGGQFVVNEALRGDDAALLKRGWRVVQDGIRHIEALSLDMLFFAGDRPLDLQPVDPGEVLKGVLDVLEESAANQGIRLRLDVPQAAEAVPLDQYAVHRAVLNLATNAIEACVDAEAGRTVTLSCRYEPDRVVLSVEDDGAGVPEALLGRIADRFFTTKPTKGTGLGLPVARRIADQHGGTLAFTSTPGCGATFSLHLPREREAGKGDAGRGISR